MNSTIKDGTYSVKPCKDEHLTKQWNEMFLDCYEIEILGDKARMMMNDCFGYTQKSRLNKLNVYVTTSDKTYFTMKVNGNQVYFSLENNK